MMGFQGKDTIPCNWEGKKTHSMNIIERRTLLQSQQVKRSMEYTRKLNGGPDPSKSSRLS